MMKIDSIDRSILAALSQNSRMTMKELGQRINLSSPSVTERIRQMESHGIIQKYTIKVNHEKLGQPVQCIIEATIKDGNYTRFKKHIEQLPNVDFCYRIAGKACYMLKMQFESFAEVENFIDAVSPFALTVTHFIFSEVHS